MSTFSGLLHGDDEHYPVPDTAGMREELQNRLDDERTRPKLQAWWALFEPIIKDAGKLAGRKGGWTKPWFDKLVKAGDDDLLLDALDKMTAAVSRASAGRVKDYWHHYTGAPRSPRGRR